MGLSQALSTGISGLVTHQKAMDNCGNNLANVNTTGFKKGVFQFRTLLEQTFRGGMGADAQTGRGSINPISLGLGTQTGSINKVFTQGPLENTASPNDMAIEGNGFFVLGQGNGYVYTRDGSFYLGADGSLMGGNGLFVQGTMAVKDANGSILIPQDAKLENIIIPIGETGGMSQTSKVEFKGNVSSAQTVATGLRLFGGVSYPTQGNLQQWMDKDFNGGPLSDTSVDRTWMSLEEQTFVVSREMLALASEAQYGYNIDVASMVNPTNLSTFTLGIDNPTDLESTRAYYAINPANGELINVQDTWGTPTESVTFLLGQGYIPVVEEVKTINGGNVQTSAAYAITLPEYLNQGVYTDPNTNRTYTIANDYTYPQWVYESTGSPLSYGEIVDLLNAMDVTQANTADPTSVNMTLKAIWPNGINGSVGTGIDEPGWPAADLTATALTNIMPRPGETIPASLTTPLENLRYQKGNTWVQAFANIRDGDEITINFKKGQSQVEATFVYNRPGPDPLNPPQQALDIERSYTLEHFLKFLAGDVDEPSAACQRITPAMYGAPITDEYPEGNPHDTTGVFDRGAYEAALQNVALAQTARNQDDIGGAMGLLSIPPQISSNNYGDDAYDSPVESAGAYSRQMENDTKYQRYDEFGNLVTVEGDSFRVSFVSNLGSENALSNIRISYNNVPHEAMFSAEKEYSAPEGGSAVATMTFYDSLGNPKQATVRLAMVEQDTDFTTWRWYADCIDDTDFPWQVDPNTGEIISNLNIGTGLIRFDKNGNFVKGAEYSETGGITINQVEMGVNEPIVIQLLNGLSPDVQQDLDFSFMTMSAAKNDFTLKAQNGAPPGTLDSFQVSVDGVIQGVYSNGVVAPIARLILALIPNMNGLVAAGNNIFYTGPSSGDAQFGYANLGGRGEIRHMQLETSNVDLSEEFTKLISIERGFQANSRTITTADEMLQELLNLKR